MNERLAKLFSDSVLHTRGWNYSPWLVRLEELQWVAAEEVERYRLQRLRDLIRHCYEHVPYYRDEFRRLKLTPADIISTDDLRQIPKIPKATLRSDYTKFYADSGGGRFDTWKSSGSTGEPFPFRLSKETVAMNTFAALARGRRWWGMDFGVREGMIWSGARDVGGTLSARLAALKRRISWRMKNIKIVDVYRLDEEAVREAYGGFLAFKPVFLRSIASGLYRFCETIDQLGLDGKALGVRTAVFTGEGLLKTQRSLIERVLGCRTVAEYGCTELGVIAFECPRGGLHLTHENHIAEFEKDGRKAHPGELAELVITNLNDRTAPLVRYAIGDFVVPTDHKCPCGRSLPLISSVEGRTHDRIITPSGQVVHALYFTHMFDSMPSVHQFRVVQDDIRQLRIELRSTHQIPSHDREFVRSAAEKAMGPDVKVEVIQVEEIPVSPGGKQRWIISNVNTGDKAEENQTAHLTRSTTITVSPPESS